MGDVIQFRGRGARINDEAVKLFKPSEMCALCTNCKSERFIICFDLMAECAECGTCFKIEDFIKTTKEEYPDDH